MHTHTCIIKHRQCVDSSSMINGSSKLLTFLHLLYPPSIFSLNTRALTFEFLNLFQSLILPVGYIYFHPSYSCTCHDICLLYIYIQNFIPFLYSASCSVTIIFLYNFSSFTSLFVHVSGSQICVLCIFTKLGSVFMYIILFMYNIGVHVSDFNADGDTLYEVSRMTRTGMSHVYIVIAFAVIIYV